MAALQAELARDIRDREEAEAARDLARTRWAAAALRPSPPARTARPGYTTLYNCAENILVGALFFLNVSECQVSKSCNSDAYPRPMSHMCFHKDRHGNP
jgi:hypothetical protein